MQNILTPKKNYITGAQIKWIAIFTMTMGCVAEIFLTQYPIICVFFKSIGAIAIPLLCFITTNELFSSQNPPRYIGKMFLFAIISEIPFTLFYINTHLHFSNYPFKQDCLINVTFFILLLYTCYKIIANTDKKKMLFTTAILCAISSLIIYLCNALYGNNIFDSIIYVAYAFYVSICSFPNNVFFSITICLCSLYLHAKLLSKCKNKKILASIPILLGSLLLTILCCDYGILCIAYSTLFYITRKNNLARSLALLVIIPLFLYVMQFGISPSFDGLLATIGNPLLFGIMSIIPISLYNGKSGNAFTNKYFGYAYPSMLIALLNIYRITN